MHHHTPTRRLDHISDLFEQSSFGTPAAAAVRASITDPDAAHPTRRADYLAHGLDPHLQRHYARGLHISDQAMHSQHTPEFAFRVPGAPDTADWQLSWLPGRRLTRGEALLGMILDEVLSNPDLLDDPAIGDLAVGAAAGMGLDLREALQALAQRWVQRRHGLCARDLATT
ncbi:hypothetical protein [Nocardia sp. CDC160]|uniref:hypothetical protein n=1 Tax=Nocardia sp. CDC160 TaxID=3112166 RepID=UPI002DB8712D|nr:hypothetical protein [Nocardia sp. CDC160]MEC3917367.1 hypothetical protein [Nocardia sp. CDC160]